MIESAPRRGIRATIVVVLAVVALAVAALPAAAVSSVEDTATGSDTGVLSGRLVDAASGRGAPYVLVLAYEEPVTTPEAAALTNRYGYFAITGLTGEEYGVRVISLLRFESGWVSCPPYRVVPTFGDACTHAVMPLGDISIERR